MKILLTNDDGLRAPGIQALYEVLAGADAAFPTPLGELIAPIAPLTVQSATSHGVTFHEPLMIREERLGWAGKLVAPAEMSGIAVDGRPADCVKLALATLWPERFGEGSHPDILISGMNAGANVGVNVIYSGTVAAAIEGAFLGIPAIAVSLHLGKGKPDFRGGARHARRAIEAVLEAGLPERHACLSINVPITELGSPAASPEARYPIRVAPMNTHALHDRYERRVSPQGDVYYWSTAHGMDFRTTDEKTDAALLFQRVTTVTPLRYDLTKKSVMERWRGRVDRG